MPRISRRFVLTGLGALVLARSVRAQGQGTAQSALDLFDAPVSFTAAFSASSDKGTYSGTVWHAPGKERRTFQTEGGEQSLILRRDTGKAYLLKPGGRWYVGLSLAAAAGLAGGLDSMRLERKRLREERVHGHPGTRWRVKASGAKGSFDGDMWTSADGIVLKVAGTVDTPRKRIPVETSLSNIRTGPVDDALFDLPKGFFGMDLSNVPAESIEQAVESLKPLLEGRGK